MVLQSLECLSNHTGWSLYSLLGHERAPGCAQPVLLVLETLLLCVMPGMSPSHCLLDSSQLILQNSAGRSSPLCPCEVILEVSRQVLTLCSDLLEHFPVDICQCSGHRILIICAPPLPALRRDTGTREQKDTTPSS